MMRNEDMPMEARGLFSGILQQGYALGYLIAAGSFFPRTAYA